MRILGLAAALRILVGVATGSGPGVGVCLAQVVEVARTTGSPGGPADLEVGFFAQEAGASAVTVDLQFDLAAPIAARDGAPACDVNPAIEKESTSFVFLPAGCTPGADCARVRAGVISFAPATNSAAIPSGAIFTCAVAIPAAASLEEIFRVDVASASAVFVNGDEIDVTGTSHGGYVRVADEAGSCPGDLNENGDVTLGEVHTAFNNFVAGCPLEP